MVEDRHRLNLLVEHPGTQVLASPDDRVAPATMSETVGLHDAVCAVISAITFDCDVLTTRPLLYGGLPGGGPVIAIP